MKLHHQESASFYFLGELLSKFFPYALLLPFLFSWQETGIDWAQGSPFLAFAQTLCISLSLGLLFKLFTKPLTKDPTIKDGFLIVTLGWIAMSALGALPFFFYKNGLEYTNAFFETMSGFTTTGASTMTDIEAFPKSILFWRALIQWLGGMGIVVLSLALLPSLGVVGYQLFQAEVPGPTADKIVPRIRDTVRILWIIYTLLSCLQILLLFLGGVSLYESVCHTFATMSTGGFSTKNASIAHYSNTMGNHYVQWIVMLFMFLGGLNFALYHQVWLGNLKALYKNSEVQFYTFTVFFSAFLIALALYFTPVEQFHGRTLDPSYEKSSEYQHFSGTLRDSLFTSITIITTTGFGTVDFNKWSDSLRLFILLLMLIGGCAGSTAGGIKTIRLLLLMKIVLRQPKTYIKPNVLFRIKIVVAGASQKVEESTLNAISVFFILHLFLHAFASLLMVALGVELLTSVSAVFSAFNNVGPGLNSLGPVGNYADLPNSAKWLLSFCMLLGRLEFYSVLVLLIPYTWKN